jgi:hypothetical protein
MGMATTTITEAEVIEAVDDAIEAMSEAARLPHLSVVVDVARFVREVAASEAKRLADATTDPAVASWAREMAAQFSAPWTVAA